MRAANLLAVLGALAVLITVLSAAIGLPAALGSTPALLTAGLVTAIVVTIVMSGRAGAGPRTPYW